MLGPPGLLLSVDNGAFLFCSTRFTPWFGRDAFTSTHGPVVCHADIDHNDDADGRAGIVVSGGCKVRARHVELADSRREPTLQPLVVGQFACAIVLPAGAGLLIRGRSYADVTTLRSRRLVPMSCRNRFKTVRRIWTKFCRKSKPRPVWSPSR